MGVENTRTEGQPLEEGRGIVEEDIKHEGRGSLPEMSLEDEGKDWKNTVEKRVVEMNYLETGKQEKANSIEGWDNEGRPPDRRTGNL